jgi:hypothetical protein
MTKHYSILHDKIKSIPLDTGLIAKLQFLLADKNIVLTQHENRPILVSANKCIGHMSQNDTIPNFMYKLPNKYFKKYSGLFQNLGSSDTITAKRCQHILQCFAVQDCAVQDKQFEAVLIILKNFLFGKITDTSYLKTNPLFMPNVLKKMMPLSEMYYVDNNYLGELLNRNYPSYKSTTLFDINELIGFIEKDFKSINQPKKNDDNKVDEIGVGGDDLDSNKDDGDVVGEYNVMRSLGAFDELTWPRVFKMLQLNKDKMPKPVSRIFVTRLALVSIFPLISLVYFLILRS